MVWDSRQIGLEGLQKDPSHNRGNFPKKAGEIFEVNNHVA